ncbi:MAG: peptide chain release factor N(5)-glutamine methyltransferase [Pirellulaceae bacterium]|nr:peptide chain release factor N(5)-glutamine methyltransferase [Pirellulaceae bacterium]
MSLSEQPWTLLRLLNWTTNFLKEKKATSPRLDAEVLLAYVLNCERIALYTRFEEVPSEEVKRRFRELIKRRADGEPVAYLVGYREFYSRNFSVSNDVLIPRPETEHLVVETLEIAKGQFAREQLNILEVGVGSGAVVVTLAKELPQANFVAVDICPKALEVARKNSITHGVDQRVELVKSNLLESLPGDSRFQLIVSNPPYLAMDEFEGLESTVKDYEPIKALIGGDCGTELIETLIGQAKRHLYPGGYLLLEVSPFICGKVEKLLQAEPNYDSVIVKKDLAQLERNVLARYTPVSSSLS